MGATVLNPEAQADPSVRVYAQCMRAVPGGVALVAMNTDAKAKHSIAISTPVESYKLTSDALTSNVVSLNGVVLRANEDGSLPALNNQHVEVGTIELAPVSLVFMAVPSAKNPACTGK